MFIPSYRFINFEEFFQPTCLFRPTGLLILSIVYSILQDYYSEDFSNIHVYSTLQVYQFWWIFPTYLLTWLAGASRSRYIRMQHCRIKATDGVEFWISCKRPAFLSSFGLLQVIQNKRPWCWNAAYVTAGLFSSMYSLLIQVEIKKSINEIVV